MIQGKKDLIQWFEGSDTCFYWTMYKKKDHANGNYYDSTMVGGEMSFADSKQKLERALQLIQSGDYIIVCNDAPTKSSKGRRQTDFSISSFEAQPAQPAATLSGIPQGYVSEEQVQVIADKKFKELMQQQEFKKVKEEKIELEKEVKELREKSESGINKLISGLAPHLGGILGEIFPKAIPVVSAVHGTGDEDIQNNHVQEAEVVSDEVSEKVQQVIEDFCGALAKQYPDKWLEVLVKLTNTITNEPAKIDMALKFL